MIRPGSAGSCHGHVCLLISFACIHVCNDIAGEYSVSDMSFNEKLIETVRDYPVLYDSAHMDYRDTKRKDNIWIKISEKLCKYDTSRK